MSRRNPNPGDLYRDAGGRLLVAVVVDADAGGGLAYLRIDPFDPRRPEMIPAWSHRTEDLRLQSVTPVSTPIGEMPTVVSRHLPTRDQL